MIFSDESLPLSSQVVSNVLPKAGAASHCSLRGLFKNPLQLDHSVNSVAILSAKVYRKLLHHKHETLHVDFILTHTHILALYISEKACEGCIRKDLTKYAPPL